MLGEAGCGNASSWSEEAWRGTGDGGTAAGTPCQGGGGNAGGAGRRRAERAPPGPAPALHRPQPPSAGPAPRRTADPANLKKSAELFFPPEFADDFPVSMQIRRERTLPRLSRSCPSCPVPASRLPQSCHPPAPRQQNSPVNPSLSSTATSTAWCMWSPSWACSLCTTWKPQPQSTARASRQTRSSWRRRRPRPAACWRSTAAARCARVGCVRPAACWRSTTAARCARVWGV
jgi:hypothetical protein